MAMYMLMAKYSPAALKAIVESGSDREAAARQAVEAAGGKLHGFYGMFGQEYGLAMIVEAPGVWWLIARAFRRRAVANPARVPACSASAPIQPWTLCPGL